MKILITVFFFHFLFLLLLNFSLPLSLSLFFNWRKTALQCCVGFCHRICESALIIHITLLSWASLPFSHPTPVGHHRAPCWAPCVIQQLLTSYSYVDATFSIHATLSLSLSLSHHVYKFILYICISIPSLQIGFLILFF